MDVKSLTGVSQVSEYLASGERLVWSGRPIGGIRFRSADIILVPFSLFWCGFAIFWEVAASAVGAMNQGGPIRIAWIFPVFGLPFVVFGLYLVVGRFIADAQLRQRTSYGVTNERIVIVRTMFGRRVKSISLRTLGEVTLSERSDGSGSITFGSGHPYARWASIWPGGGDLVAPAFNFIEHARAVYETIRQAQNAAV